MLIKTGTVVKAVAPRNCEQFLLKEQVNLYSNLDKNHWHGIHRPVKSARTEAAMSGIAVGIKLYSKIHCGLGPNVRTKFKMQTFSHFTLQPTTLVDNFHTLITFFPARMRCFVSDSLKIKVDGLLIIRRRVLY